MLFSNDQVARTINQLFEPVWFSVRAVPIVRIDFGNGNVLTRTLHGNIASYVCTADGKVLDVMPGIYEPKTYTNRLTQFTMLHRWFSQPGENRHAKLKRYHESQANVLAKGEPPHVITLEVDRKINAEKRPVSDLSKTLRIELPMKLVLSPPAAVPGNGGATPAAATKRDTAGAPGGVDSKLWKSLADDTRINESTRRRMIHKHLAKQALVAPGDITKWLYREVLHADLDDPYLGLGETLFATYPFRDEDGS